MRSFRCTPSAAPRTLHVLALAMAGLGLLGCGSATSTRSPLSDAGDIDRTVSVQTDDWRADVMVRRSDGVAVTAVPVSRADLWQHLKQAWLDIGLPAASIDDANYRLTLSDHTVRRRLGDTPLASYLSCGTGMTGEHANTHRIHLTVRSILEPVGPDSTELHTRVDATASPTAGNTTAILECSSRGRLETRLSNRVLQLLASSMLD